MNFTDRQIQMAKKRLAARPVSSREITCFGVSLEHFSAEELRKIVALTMDHAASEKKFYETAIDGFRSLSR